MGQAAGPQGPAQSTRSSHKPPDSRRGCKWGEQPGLQHTAPVQSIAQQQLLSPRAPHSAIPAAWQRVHRALGTRVASPLPGLGAPHHTKPSVPLSLLRCRRVRSQGTAPWFLQTELAGGSQGSVQELQERANPRMPRGHLKTCQGTWEAAPPLRVWLRNHPQHPSRGAAPQLRCRQGCAPGLACGNSGTAFAQGPAEETARGRRASRSSSS